VRNGRADDVYEVKIPFLIGYNKHFQDKFSAKVMPNGDPPQRMYDDYYYCFGHRGNGDVTNVQQNEREVFIVRIGHLTPGGTGSFSITYTGNEKLQIEAGAATFVSEPYSYSPMQSTIGARGDYRICKIAIAADGLVGK
jgi:hypothetical protein